jgi:hypothetical protein
VATTRTAFANALEFAVVVLSSINPSAGRRVDFIGATGLDPRLLEDGRARQAARILSAVLAALRRQDIPSQIDPSEVRETV